MTMYLLVWMVLLSIVISMLVYRKLLMQISGTVISLGFIRS